LFANANRFSLLKNIRYGIEIVEIILIVFALSWGIRTFVFDFAKVHDNGMFPNLRQNNHVFVDKFIKNTTITRGSVVVLYYEDNGEESLRRLIGLAGDKVEIRNGFAYVNDQPFYIKNAITPITYTFPPVTVPEGQVFVLNDNRTDENDSRTWGSISEEQIVGEAEFCYWPWQYIKAL